MDEDRESYESGAPLVSDLDAREFLGLDEMPRMHTTTYQRLGNNASVQDSLNTAAPLGPEALPEEPAS